MCVERNGKYNNENYKKKVIHFLLSKLTKEKI